MNSVIEIKLLGQDYSLGTELDTSRAKAVAKCVAEKVEEVERESEGYSKLDIIILAALDIANDFLEVREKHTDFIEDIASRSQFLLHKIETGSPETFAKRSVLARVGSPFRGDDGLCHGMEREDSGREGA